MARLMLLFVLVVGCQDKSPLKPQAPAIDLEKKAEPAPLVPSCQEERIALKFIVDNANVPESVKLIDLGPNDLKGEILSTAIIEVDKLRKSGLWQRTCVEDRLQGLKTKIVRVVYQDKGPFGRIDRHDVLVFIQNGAAVKTQVNEWEGDWRSPALKEARELIARAAKITKENEEFHRISDAERDRILNGRK